LYSLAVESWFICRVQLLGEKTASGQSLFYYFKKMHKLEAELPCFGGTPNWQGRGGIYHARKHHW